MRGTGKVFLAAVLALVGTTSMQRPARVQQLCGFCSDKPDMSVPDQWVHTSGQQGALLNCGTAGCHYSAYDGLCGWIHSVCSYVSVDTDALLAAGKRGDERKLREALASRPRYVRLDAAAPTIEIANCQGTGVASSSRATWRRG